MEGKRKLDTDDIVAKAMQEEEGRKRTKKHAAPPLQGAQLAGCRMIAAARRRCCIYCILRCAGKGNKGLSLSEVEAADGGVVKEGLVTTAQHKRALQRKRKTRDAGERR